MKIFTSKKLISWLTAVIMTVMLFVPFVNASEVFDPEKTVEKSEELTLKGGDNKEYSVLRGVTSMPDFLDDDKDIDVIYYYSDAYFTTSPKKYNEHLATFSSCFALAASYSNLGGQGQDASYINKSSNGRRLLSDIGVKDEDIYVNRFNLNRPSGYSIGVTIGLKKISNGKNVIMIGVRGSGYESEWLGNFTLGSSGDSKGFAEPAEIILGELNRYLEKRGINPKANDTCFYVTGYSRGGAVANLLSKRLVDNYDNKGERTYAYCLEAPMGGLRSEKKSNCDYSCIHNIINKRDPVTYIAPFRAGFIRYGVDHFVPGEAKSGAVNVYNADNNFYYRTSDDYSKQKNKMIIQLGNINPGIKYDDYYQPAEINYVKHAIFGSALISPKYTKQSIESILEDFMQDFWYYGFNYKIDSNHIDGDLRNSYAVQRFSNGLTAEEGIKRFAEVVFSLNSNDLNKLMSVMKSIPDRIDTQDLYFDVVRGWSSSSFNSSKVQNVIKDIWNAMANHDGGKDLRDVLLIDDGNGIPITDYSTIAQLKEAWFAIAPPLLEYVSHDYDKSGNDELASILFNVEKLIMNHYPEVTMAWLRTYDKFYEYDTGDPVEIDREKVKAPSAPKLTYLNKAVNVVPGSDEDTNKGVAVYYRLLKGDLAGEWTAAEKNIPLSELTALGSDKQIKIEAFTMYYDQKSDTVKLDVDMNKVLNGGSTASIFSGSGRYVAVIAGAILLFVAIIAGIVIKQRKKSK